MNLIYDSIDIDITYCKIGFQNHEIEEGGTPYIDTWHNARVWIDFFGGLH